MENSQHQEQSGGQEVVPQPSAAPQPENHFVLPGTITLLKDAFSFYRSHLNLIFSILLIPGIVYLIAVLFNVFVPGGIGEILFIVSTILNIFAYVALLAAIVKSGTGEITGAKSAYKLSQKYILSFLWIGILSALAIMGGFLLFIIPGIYISVLVSFSMFVLIAEDIHGMKALIRSSQYVKGHWWPVFGRLFFFGVIVFLAVIVISIIAAAFGFDTGSFSPQNTERAGAPAALQSLTQLISLFVITPLSYIFSYRLYHILRSAKSVSSVPEQEQKMNRMFTIFSIIGIIAIVGILIFTFFILGALIGGLGGTLPEATFL